VQTQSAISARGPYEGRGQRGGSGTRDGFTSVSSTRTLGRRWAARRSDRPVAAPGADAVLVCGPGSCLEVDRRRAQNGSCGGTVTG